MLKHALTDLWRYHERKFPIYQQIGHGLQSQKREWVGERFREFVPYQSGMNVRQIHWASFMKNRELLMKTYDQQQFGEICFLIDQSASCQLKNQKQSQSKFQSTIEIILAICASAIASGHQCRIFYLANESKELQQILVFHLEAWKQLAQILIAMQDKSMPAPWESWLEAIHLINPKSKLIACSDFFDFPIHQWQCHRDMIPLQLSSITDQSVEMGRFYDDFEDETSDIVGITNQSDLIEFQSRLTSYQNELKMHFQRMKIPLLEISLESDLNQHYQKIISKLMMT
jgi:hypothetical protein